MCGLFGIISAVNPIDPAICARAHSVQGHRGPDAHGDKLYRIADCEVLLGHQRLAILDLSDAGRQPMERPSADGALIYNGELYNYVELGEELRKNGEVFSTRTDTEVLLAALHHWPLERALRSFNWMGAFAWLDIAGKRLVLARDPGAEKPLYIAKINDKVFFSSELKTILVLTGQRFTLSPQVIGEYLWQNLADSGPSTIFQGITQLEPGHFVEIRLRNEISGLKSRPYWQAPEPWDHPWPMEKLTTKLSSIFTDAVRIRLRSDVPVGVLLSGGLDSSAIASVANELLGPDQPLLLLSAVSEDPRFDESPFVDIMADHLQRQVVKARLDINEGNILDNLAKVSWHNDEPVGSLSNVAHFHLMEKARELGITVILSGQGADELLLGYRKYLGFYLQWLARTHQIGKAISTLGAFVRNRTIVTQFSIGDAKRYLPLVIRRHLDREDVDIRGEWLSDYQPVSVGLGSGDVNERQLMDIRNFSVPALCHSEDRMSMAWSREIRLPFLDPRLMDLLLAAPPDYKLRNGWTKFCFRQAMGPLLPDKITWRRDKQGFVNPQSEWLKNGLRSAVLEHFAEDSLIFEHGIVERSKLLKKYTQYCRQPAEKGTIWYREIFAPLALEIWMRRYSQWIS